MTYRVVSDGASGTRKGWTHVKGTCPTTPASAQESLVKLITRLLEKHDTATVKDALQNALDAL